MKSGVRPWLKLALLIISGIALFSVVGILVLNSILPEPAKFGKSLAAKPTITAPALKPVALSKLAHARTPENSDSSKNLAADSNTEVTRHGSIMTPAERRRLVTSAFVDRYLGTGRLQSHVCENLGNHGPPFTSAKEFGRQLERSLLGESPPSAAIEAIMLPVEYSLKNEAIRELVNTAKEAADRGDSGFLKKAHFYAMAAQATASLLNSRDELETISANAYRLYALSRATTLKPDLLQDPDLSDLCRGFERSIVDGLAQDTAIDRDRLARLLQRHEITNESIGYDPDAATGIRVGRNGFSLELPWLEKVFVK